MDHAARLHQASEELERVGRHRDKVVFEATEAGMSHRQVAAASGLSCARVKEIVAAGR